MTDDNAEGNASTNGSANAHTVFLSYSRVDKKKAVSIVNALEQAGFSVWWDGLLEGGERFLNSTEEALANAKAVVVLWSKTSIGSHWVHDEATRGRDSGRLVPLSIDGSDPPLGFGQFQCLDVSRSSKKPASPGMQNMLRAVAALHDNRELSEPQKASGAALLTRRNALLGGAAVIAAGSGYAIWKNGVFSSDSTSSSIAVLPFANLSGDPDQNYFSDGLTSEIRLELSRNALLQVVGQTSSNQFRDHDSDAQSIADELGVSFLLEGNVQKAGDTVKIATDLLDGGTGISKWSQTFERPLTDVFALQSEIAIAVATALSAAIDSGSRNQNQVQAGGTESVAAFDSYLRGRDLFELHIDDESYRKALAKFDEAIAIDPKYAAARAFRSRTLAVLGNQTTQTEQRKSLYNEAVQEAQLAVEIAAKFAPGFSALGHALFYGRLDVKGAREPYDKAYSLAKSDVDVFSRYAIYCARIGRFAEADAAIQRALALDPLNPSIFKSAGNIKYAEKRYDEAIELGRKALKLNPERSTVHGDIGNAYLMLGELEKARAEFEVEPNSLIGLPGRAVLVGKRG
ncbi:TIR domain-containing protein, partial [Parasphingorhabdus sp.]|uniref:TIR domain-containing protein n=1 Tax=Parasphingorhabdus sp. TaxID=2709688 RepID=UPI003C7402FE